MTGTDAARTAGAALALVVMAGMAAGCSAPAPGPAPDSAPSTAVGADPGAEAEAFPDLSDIICAPTGGRWSLAATLTNPGTDQVTYTITPSADTVEGVVLGTATVTVVVGPRSARPVTVKDFAVQADVTGVQATCTISAVKTA